MEWGDWTLQGSAGNARGEMKRNAVIAMAAILVLLWFAPTTATAGVGGATEGVGGAQPTKLSRVDTSNLGSLAGRHSEASGVGGATEGVGGATEGVGGAVDGVGGAVWGVGGASSGVGGALSFFSKLPDWLQHKLIEIAFRR